MDQTLGWNIWSRQGEDIYRSTGLRSSPGGVREQKQTRSSVLACPLVGIWDGTLGSEIGSCGSADCIALGRFDEWGCPCARDGKPLVSIHVHGAIEPLGLLPETTTQRHSGPCGKDRGVGGLCVRPPAGFLHRGACRSPLPHTDKKFPIFVAR
jgi:hypothetical protein